MLLPIFGHAGCVLGWLPRFRVGSYGGPEFRLRLVRPESHVHLAVHPGRGRQELGGLCLVTGAISSARPCSIHR